MAMTRRQMIAYGAAASLSPLAAGDVASGQATTQNTPATGPLPAQVASDRPARAPHSVDEGYDMREALQPRRATMAMWDVAYALRHAPGGSFADYDRVLGELVDRAYNTVRIDPMPQWLDLRSPDRVLEWPDPHQPFMPWNWNTAVKGPVGLWVIEFIEKLLRKTPLHYTLSAWWFLPAAPPQPPVPPPLRRPANMLEGAEMWAAMLTEWKRRFGLDRILYVDIANETPYFFPGFLDRFKKEASCGWSDLPAFSPAQSAFIAREVNEALHLLRREFPELRFTTSIHGDLRWLDVPVELDCLDVHFYADADPRWTERTRFDEFSSDHLFATDRWFAEFSQRSSKTATAMAPMLRARQRFKMAEFAAWASRRGAPLTTSEGFATWYYIDHPDLDWGWLLDWAKGSLEDAIDCKFWGWTPHNYVQPQFKNWQDAAWHRSLNERFLAS